MAPNPPSGGLPPPSSRAQRVGRLAERHEPADHMGHTRETSPHFVSSDGAAVGYDKDLDVVLGEVLHHREVHGHVRAALIARIQEQQPDWHIMACRWEIRVHYGFTIFDVARHCRQSRTEAGDWQPAHARRPLVGDMSLAPRHSLLLLKGE